MENIIACVVTAAISLPVSFLIAGACLRGVLRIVTGPTKRSML